MKKSNDGGWASWQSTVPVGCDWTAVMQSFAVGTETALKLGPALGSGGLG